MTNPQAGNSTPQTLDDLLSKTAVDLELTAANKTEAIEALLISLERDGALENREQAYEDLLARERQGSTGLGHGVAIPHAKTIATAQPILAFARSPGGLDFDALDRDPVRLIFLFLVPRNRAGLHLKVVSALTRFLRQQESRRQLLAAADAEEVHRLLRGVSIASDGNAGGRT